MTDEGPRFDTSDDDLLQKLTEWGKQHDSHWADWQAEARESYDMVAGHQWSDADIELMKDQQRIPVTFNRMEPVIDAVSGAEIMGRQAVTYLPRTVDDTGKTDVISQGAAYVRQNCDAEDEESDSFRDALICGVGWTQTVPSYEEELDGEIIIERIDPLEMTVDPTSRKGNFADARHMRRRKKMSREEADEAFPGAYFDRDSAANVRQPVIVDPEVRYKNGAADTDDDEVTVEEWQWFETEPVIRATTLDGQVMEITEEQFDEIVAELGHEPEHVRQKRRVYYKAFICAGEVRDRAELVVKDFTYKATTAKRDRNKGTYYGLARPMMDPQRFTNTTVSAMINHYRATAKGGVMAEAGAVDDQRAFEKSWSDAQEITWVPNGALSSPDGPRITQKPVSQMPPALPQILEFSMQSVRDSTGVNQELLGLADRQQPGILEHQRKQSAYGILSAFFNSHRRYRKMQGRLLLVSMKEYLPEGYLVRIVDEGEEKYVALAFSDDTMKFDVIVDEAPDSPNVKQRVSAIIMQLLPIFGDSVPPELLGEAIKYTELPAALTEKIVKSLNAPQGPDPMAELAQAGAQAKIQETQSKAALNAAKAQKSEIEAARDLTETMRAEAEAAAAQTINQALNGGPLL